MLYRMFIPPIVAGANKVHWDLFNGPASPCIEVVSILPVVSSAVAVTGAVAIDLYLTRTKDVGTGGTAATFEGTSLTAINISVVNTGRPISGKAISARAAPSGGATAGPVICLRSIFSEETNAGTYIPAADMAAPSIHVQPRSGLRVVQGSVASVGLVGFDVTFRLCA
jgi:hypothetical protein